ncbi:MAG: hypothetical protein V4605_05265 [Pseudomonadota bacterium]
MSTVSAIKVQSIDETPDQQINQLYQTALKAHQNGDFKTAREHYLRVLDLHSAHIKTLYLLVVYIAKQMSFYRALSI